MCYVAGRAFVTGLNFPNIDQHGYTPGVVGANDDAGHSTVQNERLKNGYKGSTIGENMVRFCADPAWSLLWSRGRADSLCLRDLANVLV